LKKRRIEEERERRRGKDEALFFRSEFIEKQNSKDPGEDV